MAAKIPATGLSGAALREAVTEFKAIIEVVREALKAKLRSPENPDPWPCIEAIWPDRVVRAGLIAGDGEWLPMGDNGA